jgi:hypothetical protein
MPYPGSQDTLTLTVDPFDVTTGVTVTVAGPNGSNLAPTAVSTDNGHTWTAHVAYGVAGKWVAVWTVTGTGAGTTEQEVWVTTPATPIAAVTWRPALWNVADYVPGRTLVGAVDGYGNALLTFDNTTHPTDQQVQRIITAGCAWIGTRCTPIHTTLSDMALAVAATWAAARIELTWPDNRDDLNTAEQLLAQATTMRDDLCRANQAVSGEDDEDPEAHLMPVWSFPRALDMNPAGDWAL